MPSHATDRLRGHPSEAFVITWSLMPPENTNVLASLLFKRLDRRWKLYFQEGLLRLHYVQGLELVARQVLHEGHM